MKLTKQQLRNIIKEEIGKSEASLLTEAATADVIPLLMSISREGTDPERGRGSALYLAADFFHKLSAFLDGDAHQTAANWSKKFSEFAGKV